MRYLLAILLLATVARANDFSPLQVDGANNVTVPASLGSPTATFGSATASVAMDSTGHIINTNALNHSHALVCGTNADWHYHNAFGYAIGWNTNGLNQSNAVAGVQYYEYATNNGVYIVVMGIASTNSFFIPTNGSPPQWNGIAIVTNANLISGIPTTVVSNNTGIAYVLNGSSVTNLAGSMPTGTTTNLYAVIGGTLATTLIPLANLPSSGGGSVPSGLYTNNGAATLGATNGANIGTFLTLTNPIIYSYVGTPTVNLNTNLGNGIGANSGILLTKGATGGTATDEKEFITFTTGTASLAGTTIWAAFTNIYSSQYQISCTNIAPSVSYSLVVTNGAGLTGWGSITAHRDCLINLGTNGWVFFWNGSILNSSTAYSVDVQTKHP